MYKLKLVDDISECEKMWKRYWKTSSMFDLWEIRKCFVDSFKRSNIFLVLENGNEIHGILPLSWIEESSFYSFFPGETWHGKTWLEQNKVYAVNNNAFQILLNNIPGPSHMRYMCANSLYFNENLIYDESNYHLLLGEFNNSFENYMQKFSNKSRKSLNKEISVFHDHGVKFRYNDLRDVDTLFDMNRNSFGEDSYFQDPRFYASFQSAIKYLYDNSMLRIVSVEVGGEIAAVDIGSVHGSEYVVLGGGTNPEFKGIAKLINFHHIDWACKNQISKIDFLCGDFGWKERFHLTSQPLYKIKLDSIAENNIAIGIK